MHGQQNIKKYLKKAQHITLDITLPILKCLQVKISKYIKKIDKYRN